MAVDQSGFCSDIVAHSVFAGIAILQVGDAIVPIVAGQAPQIGPRNQGHIGADLELRLKGECLVLLFIGRGLAAVDQEDGHRPCAGGQASFESR